MKKIILYILILSFGVPILAQDAATNMEKYWRYRKRYMNNFIIQSDDVGACGCNIPMAEIQMTSSNATSAVGSGYIKYQLSLGDGNDGYRYYLEFLASEYYLLKQNGQDCSETIKDLYKPALSLSFRWSTYDQVQQLIDGWRPSNSQSNNKKLSGPQAW